jgi:PAS domain S-box-containing protein
MKSENHGGNIFKLMVEASPNAQILVNSVGKITYANTFAEKLFEYNKPELIGQQLEILIPERFKKKHPGYMQSFYKNPETRQMGKGRDLFALKKNGLEFPVEIGLNPIATVEGMLVLVAIIDITERKKSEETLRQHTRELEMKNKELEQFTYFASHDLQEPLNTIISWGDVLKRKLEQKLMPELLPHLQFIEEAAWRMKGLINGLLEYSRIGRDLELKLVDCHELVHSVCKDLRAAIDKANAKVEINELPSVFGYELELRLLFQNLISNAIKFHRAEEPPRILVDASFQGNKWKFVVKDNGIGIDEKNQEKIFAIFHRLHHRNEYEGTGIGLAHCKKIVELHRGKIDVVSVPGEGSSFYFTINLDHS